MNIEEIHWQKTIPIRQHVLWPSKPASYCHIDNDETAWHFGVYSNNKLISVASIYPNGHQARLRKFATLHTHQNMGVGTSLLNHILRVIQKRGISELCCDARESALVFYEKFGFFSEGERFFKEHVPYLKMRKQVD